MAPLLSIQGLGVGFRNGGRFTPVLQDVSLDVGAGEIVGVVGESGSGKSVTAMAAMRLLGAEGVVTAGRILLEGRDLAALPEAELRAVRGRQMAMIFQEPMTSLNPLLTVGFQIAEGLREKLGLSRRDAQASAIALMATVGIPNADRRSHDHPHTLSGGMRQRVMIAIAMACGPRLLVADEPTTALDVTIQAQILDLMADLSQQGGAALLLITHDMGVIARMAARVVVMYAGEVVEQAPVRDLFEQPAHPYTRLLMAATPTVRHRAATLPAIPGSMPAPGRRPPGCRFHPRCPAAIERCRVEPPALRALGSGREARCHRAEEILAGLPAAAESMPA